MKDKELYIGLISGTSMDAVDCVLTELVDEKPLVLAAHAHPIPDQLSRDLLTLCSNQGTDLRLLGATDLAVGRLFAEAVQYLLAKSGLDRGAVTAIGSHGQTIWHEPPTDRQEYGYTLQIGDPNTIAELTGITTVADFRRHDMAAGGQGAPIVTALHQALLQSDTTDRIVLNLGGIANITFLPADGRTASALDTGPANVLMNIWCTQHLGKPFDAEGRWAASGKVLPELLQKMLGEAYFSRPAPKSTGRELFNSNWLQQHLQSCTAAAAENVQATLLALTTESVSREIEKLCAGGEVLVCGGGARNTTMLESLGRRLPDFTVRVTDDFGISADYLEACAFAWFASRTLRQQPLPLKAFTGATHDVIAGGVYYT